jgi:hypothetical protein
VFVLGLNVVDTPESAVYGALDVHNLLQLVGLNVGQVLTRIDRSY